MHTILHEGNITNLHFDVTPGWEQWNFLSSDNHFDSVYCNRDLLTRHLNTVLRRNALAFIFGDWYDAMQGRFDPRRSANELLPEYRRDDYYDFVPVASGDYLAPYSDHLVLWGMGNHESAVLKNSGTNLVARAIDYLNLRYKADVKLGGYGGWVNFFFHLPHGTQQLKRLKYFHGSGGEAPVTKGAIQTNRQAVYLPDADFVINGHSHNAYYIPIERERMDDNGEMKFHMQHHLRIPGYKQSYGDGSRGWEVERGNVPKPLGSWWLHMCYDEQDGLTVEACSIFGDPIPMAPPLPDTPTVRLPKKAPAVEFSQDPTDCL